MKKIQTFFLIVVATMALAFVQAEYSWFKTENYQISYPSNWEKNTEGAMGAEVIFLSPQEGAEDLFRENLNIRFQALPKEGKDITRAEWKEMGTATQTMLSSMIADLNFIRAEFVGQPGTGYYEMVYTGKLGEQKLKWSQRMYTRGQGAYILTFTGAQDEFPKFSTTAKKMFESFK